MPPNIMENYLAEFVRILKPQGLLIFQIPTQRLLFDTNTIRLRSLPRYHPVRVINKIRGVLVGDNKTTWYYRLKRLGISKRWLYDKFGLRPNIDMYVLDEPHIRDLLSKRGAKIVHVENKPNETGDINIATFAAVKSVG